MTVDPVIDAKMRAFLKDIYNTTESLTSDEIEELPMPDDALVEVVREKCDFTYTYSDYPKGTNIVKREYDILGLIYNPNEEPITCRISIGGIEYDSYTIPPKSSCFPLQGTIVLLIWLGYHEVKIQASGPYRCIGIYLTSDITTDGIRIPRRYILVPMVFEMERDIGVYEKGMFGVLERKDIYRFPENDWVSISQRDSVRAQRRCAVIKRRTPP